MNTLSPESKFLALDLPYKLLKPSEGPVRGNIVEANCGCGQCMPIEYLKLLIESDQDCKDIPILNEISIRQTDPSVRKSLQDAADHIRASVFLKYDNMMLNSPFGKKDK